MAVVHRSVDVRQGAKVCGRKRHGSVIRIDGEYERVLWKDGGWRTNVTDLQDYRDDLAGTGLALASPDVNVLGCLLKSLGRNEKGLAAGLQVDSQLAPVVGFQLCGSFRWRRHKPNLRVRNTSSDLIAHMDGDRRGCRLLGWDS
jgi:nitrous oxidase accessory protein NosD